MFERNTNCKASLIDISNVFNVVMVIKIITKNIADLKANGLLLRNEDTVFTLGKKESCMDA